MELILHIGPHKTGTTAVQTAFAGAARSLRRAGLLYPRTNWLYPAQHRLAFAMKDRRIPGRDRPDLDDEIAELRQAIRRFRGPKVLVSSEEFFAAPPAAIRRLAASLDVGQWRIVAFLRRPDDFFVSSYNQKIRQPGNGFSPPIRQFLKAPKTLAPEIDYLGCVSAWADVFGDAAIRLERYEDGPPLPRLCRILGLPESLVPADRVLNRSAPGAVAEIMRLAKASGMDPGRQAKLFRLAEARFGDAAPFHLADEDRHAVVAALEAENEILFHRFGQENPYATRALVPQGPAPIPNLTLLDLMRLVGELI